tara:strand:- start:328 stop:447 length:120 start_codon:yes stop_codon:yes gene_type:complete
MIKKILLILFISIALISCGKKGCPKTIEEDKCSEIFKKS